MLMLIVISMSSATHDRDKATRNEDLPQRIAPMHWVLTVAQDMTISDQSWEDRDTDTMNGL